MDRPKELAWRLAAAGRDVVDSVRPFRIFDRPVFVLAVPRSGSTLLLDGLDQHPDLWSWRWEATVGWNALDVGDHSPLLGDTWPASYATERLRKEAERLLYRRGVESREQHGVRRTWAERFGLRRIRYLDKSPAMSVRAGVLTRLWPDALFIHLHRDGPATVASMLEAWERGLSGPRNAPRPDGTQEDWCLLIPEGWSAYVGRTRAEKCAFQWVEGHRSTLDALDAVPAAQRCEVRYSDLVGDPVATMRRIVEFCQVDWADPVERFCRDLPPSRVVLSEPRHEKWRDRLDDLGPALPMLEEMTRRLGYEVCW